MIITNCSENRFNGIIYTEKWVLQESIWNEYLMQVRVIATMNRYIREVSNLMSENGKNIVIHLIVIVIVIVIIAIILIILIVIITRKMKIS